MASRIADRPFIAYGTDYSQPGSRPPPSNYNPRPTFPNTPTGNLLGTAYDNVAGKAPIDPNGGYTSAELEAMRLANSPRYAGLDPNEQSAYDMAAQGSGYQEDLDRSRTFTERGGASFLDADINAYMNPFVKGALDPAAREARLQGARDINDAGSQAAMAGAFGGSRSAILQSEARKNTSNTISDLYSRGYQSAFQDAATRFEGDRSAAARTAEQYRALSSQRQGSFINDINTKLTTGGLKRDLEQKKLDFNFEQFTTARDWDVNNLKPLIAALASVPHSSTTTNTAKSDAMANIIGIAATAVGAYFGGPAGAAAGASQLSVGAGPISTPAAGSPGYNPGTTESTLSGMPGRALPGGWYGVPTTPTFSQAYA